MKMLMSNSTDATKPFSTTGTATTSTATATASSPSTTNNTSTTDKDKFYASIFKALAKHLTGSSLTSAEYEDLLDNMLNYDNAKNGTTSTDEETQLHKALLRSMLPYKPSAPSS